MDYKNMYNEAKKRFKAFKEKYYTKDTNIGDAIYDKTGNMQKDFEAIFQEPNESKDERIRRELIEYLRGDLDDITTDDTDRWIAWIEKQKEQKPAEWNKETINGEPISTENQSVDIPLAEWSEVDELMRNRCIADLGYLIAYEPRYKERYDEQIDRLKSLRPVSKESLQSHWKPSEEQMKALEQAKISAVAGNYITKDSLCSLYEQLKKLM